MVSGIARFAPPSRKPSEALAKIELPGAMSHVTANFGVVLW